MPKGIPKRRAAKGEISKYAAMRIALAELGKEAKPPAYQDYIKTKFGMRIGISTISNYKSTLSKETASQSAILRRPTAPVSNPENGFSLDDIQAVKDVADRIGAEKVRQLVQVLSP